MPPEEGVVRAGWRVAEGLLDTLGEVGAKDASLLAFCGCALEVLGVKSQESAAGGAKFQVGAFAVLLLALPLLWLAREATPWGEEAGMLRACWWASGGVGAVAVLGLTLSVNAFMAASARAAAAGSVGRFDGAGLADCCC